MKATLLLENHSMFNKYYNAEHGFSAWIEDENVKILYDTGYSDKFIHNAEAMGINLMEADYVIISHAHYDHCGGLKYLIKYFRDNCICRKPTLLVTSPRIMLPKFEFNWGKKLGMDCDMDVLEKYFNVEFCSGPKWLTKNLCFMGECKIMNDFERSYPQTPKVFVDGKWEDDFVDEDTQLCYRHKNGKDCSIVAGCAHYGVCNIMEYAKELTGTERVSVYLGGSHLRSDEVPEAQLSKTYEYISKANMDKFYICHDTDLPCIVKLAQISNVCETGVGLVVECE